MLRIYHQLTFHSIRSSWKFYHKDQDVKTVIKDIKRIEKEFIKLYGKDVDIDKTQPTAGGLTGINFPFSTDEQYPYSPQGHKLSWKKFLFKYRFQHHPLVAIAAGLTEPGRHKTLCLIAAYLEKKDMFQHIDDVVDALDDFTDTDYVDRIKVDKIHEKYDVGPDAIQIRIEKDGLLFTSKDLAKMLGVTEGALRKQRSKNRSIFKFSKSI